MVLKSLSSTMSILTLFTLVPLLSTTVAASSNTVSYQQRNYNTITSIYNTTIYPNNQDFVKHGISAIPAGLFSANASGRISPVGKFSGFQESVEYFFGLTPPVSAPLYDTWTSAKIVAFTSGCPEVASSVVYGETTGVDPNVTATYGKRITTIKQVAFWRFDDDGAVLYYDAWLPSLRLYTNLLYGIPSNSLTDAVTIELLCKKAMTLCTGGNQQYSGINDCVEQLTAKNFGDWDEVWGDNIVCRSLHILLAKLRPDAHCPHVGPTGGAMCVDVKYNDVYIDNDVALFGSASDAFICPSVKQISS